MRMVYCVIICDWLEQSSIMLRIACRIDANVYHLGIVSVAHSERTESINYCCLTGQMHQLSSESLIPSRDRGNMIYKTSPSLLSVPLACF